MSSRGGRDRVGNNEPGWTERDYPDDHHYPRDWDRERDIRSGRPYVGGSSSRYDDPRESRDRRRDNRDRYRDERRGGGQRSSRRGGAPRPPRRGQIVFHSYEEEMAWVEERRRRRKERKSLFDVEPNEEQIALEELQKAALASHGPNPNVFLKPEERAPVVSYETPVISQQPQHTRHARRLYIGQVSPDLSDQDIHNFFRDCVYTAMGITNPRPEDDPIMSVYTNRERHFAFVEFVSMDITTACLALNGMNMLDRGRIVVKRPNDYNPATAPATNVDFMKKFDVSKLGIISNIVSDSPNKIFIGGLPYHLNDEQVMELLSAFGKIKAFHLVKTDSNAVTSKGYCFVEYSDEKVRDIAIMGLNGMEMGGGKVLTAKIASERAEGEGAEVGTAASAPGTTIVAPPIVIPSMDTLPVLSVSIPSTAPPIMRMVDGVDVEAMVDFAMGNSTGVVNSLRAPMTAASSNEILDIANAALLAAYGPGVPQANSNTSLNGSTRRTRILVLHNMVTDADFSSMEDYEGLKDEVEEECQKFGKLLSMKIPHPQDGYAESAIKKIFLEYATLEDAANAEHELSGRQFGNNKVQVTYYDEKDYSDGMLR